MIRSNRTTQRAALIYTTLAAALGIASCSSSGGVTPDMGPGMTGDFGPINFVGVMRCSTDSDCDDGLACTTDACVEVAGEGDVCSWTVAVDMCLIGRVCRADGERNPQAACEACNPRASRTAWSLAPDDAPCDDGDVCTFMTTCQSGVCEGMAVDCDDGNGCTANTCESGVGCVSSPIGEGMTCDDGDSCTEDDVCTGGVCAGASTCDDNDPCTADSCGPDGSCINEPHTDACDDGDPCTVGETCATGTCEGGSANTCDDQNACTADTCVSQAGGCQHIAINSPCCSGDTSICDDNDPCTTDLCDPNTAQCSYENSTAACDDGNACTVADTCMDGSCGGSPRDCSDGNDCTTDDCNVNTGCFYADLGDGSPCDDGLSCSTGDICAAGLCSADLTACGCTPTYSDAAKVTELAIGENEGPGQALDIDGDGMRDNVLGAIGGFVNEALQTAVTDGSLNLLFEYIDFSTSPFELALLTAELDPANDTCDVTTATCDYEATTSSLLPVTCERAISVDATRTGTFITAGGPGTVVPLALPLGEGAALELTLYDVHVEMTVTLQAGQVVGFTALLAGAARQGDLETAIRAVDASLLPVPPEELISLLGVIARNDIDTTGNGMADAKSIGLVLTGIDGVLTGVVGG